MTNTQRTQQNESMSRRMADEGHPTEGGQYVKRTSGKAEDIGKTGKTVSVSADSLGGDFAAQVKWDDGTETVAMTRQLKVI